MDYIADDDIRIKYHHLQKEWDNQQEHLGKVQGEIFKLRNQLQQQSQFCASLGAILGNLIWKASRVPNNPEVFLTARKIEEFVTVVSGTLHSFLETYSTHIPNQDSDETQFVLSLVGTTTNIAATAPGRDFLLGSSNGVNLLEQYLQQLPKVPVPSGDPLKRLMIMMLYNISIHRNGLRFLHDNAQVLDIIKNSLQNDSETMKYTSLRLLCSLTNNIESLILFKRITDTIPMTLIKQLSTSCDTETKAVALTILGQMDDNMQRLDSIRPPRNTKFSECYCNDMPPTRPNCP